MKTRTACRVNEFRPGVFAVFFNVTNLEKGFSVLNKTAYPSSAVA